MNCLNRLPGGRQLFGTDDLGDQQFFPLPGATPVQDLLLLFERGIADLQPHHEPIELGLRQREGSFVLNGILSRDHDERIRQANRLAIEGNLVLLHGFEQGRLGAG